jgi:hypothetical protein
MRDTIDMAREAGAIHIHKRPKEFAIVGNDSIKAFEALVRADEQEKYKWDIHSCGPTCKRYACVAVREAVEAEREAISDEWSMCVQSDLEHGVKSLNEQAAKDWFKNYPEIAKFGAWLAARGNT